MIRRPPIPTRTDTLLPYTTPIRSPAAAKTRPPEHDRRAAAPEPASTPTVREEDQQNNGHDNYPEDRGGAHALFLLLCDDSRRLGVLRPRLALGKRELEIGRAHV